MKPSDFNIQPYLDWAEDPNYSRLSIAFHAIQTLDTQWASRNKYKFVKSKAHSVRLTFSYVASGNPRYCEIYITDIPAGLTEEGRVECKIIMWPDSRSSIVRESYNNIIMVWHGRAGATITFTAKDPIKEPIEFIAQCQSQLENLLDATHPHEQRMTEQRQ
jgi:hypothetical protein